MTDSTEDITISEPGSAAVFSNASPAQERASASHQGIDAGLLFDASPWPTWILDAETFAFLAVNRAATVQYGYSEAEFAQMTLRDVCLPEDFPRFLEQLSNLPFTFEWRAVLRHRRKDGTILFAEPARQATVYNGRRAVFSILNDVTDRVRTEESLKASQELLNITLRSIGDAVITTDPQGRITLMNALAQRLTGWTEQEARGKDAREVFHIVNETTRAEVENPVLRVIAEKGIVGLANHTVLLSREGSEYPIDDSGAPILDQNGHLLGTVLVFHDISERRRQERALAESEERLRAILDNTPSIVYVKDLAGRYVLVNRAFELQNGRTLAEARGKTDVEIFPPDLCGPIVANDRHVLETGEPLQFEEGGPYEDRRLTYLSTKFPLRDAEGNIYALCGVSTDITERTRDERTRQFLTGASELLASSLDYERTLQQVADLAVPRIADWCVVDMQEEHGVIRQLAVAHVDPEKVKLAYELRRRYPLLSDEPGISAVLRTGRPEIYPHISDELLVIGAQDPEHLVMLRQIGLRSVMIVPIVAREHILGAVTFIATPESGHRYTQEDLEIAEGLAARAALAIDNARLYRAAQEELAERRRIQDALHTSEERFRFALANSTTAVYMQDSALRYTWVYSGRVGGELTYLYGKTDAEFLEADDAVRLTELKRRVLQAGVEERHVVQATYQGQELGFYDTVFVPLRDAAGNIVGITGTVNDVTERMKTQEALARHQREIETLNARLQRAMTETHHRVKNNLQLISALIDMQKATDGDMIPLSELSRLSANVRALGVIHDILTQEAKEGAEGETVSATAVLEKLVSMLQQTIGDHRLRFRCEEVRLGGKQAASLALVTNELVSNALKHGNAETDLSFRRNDHQAILEVRDDGPGFPEGFDPQKSANIGIELVENIVRWDLRGNIAYENRPEGGGKVTVLFSIAQG